MQEQQHNDVARVLEAIEVFRFLPRPKAADLQKLKSILEGFSASLADRTQTEAVDKSMDICNFVMDQCHLQLETSLDFVSDALVIPLHDQDNHVQKIRDMALQEDYPLVVGEKAIDIFSKVCELRRAMEREREEDARNLHAVVVKLQESECSCASKDAQNEKLLQQSVDMVLEIGNLKRLVAGLEEGLKGGCWQEDDENELAKEVSATISNFFHRKRKRN